MENELIRGNFNVSTLKDEYLSYIDVSNNTVETYDVGIKQFLLYLKENNITNPTREDVLSFRRWLSLNHSVATVNGYLIAVRNFFKFLEFKGVYKNITENVKSLKDTDIHKREALDIETCLKLINNAKDDREELLLTLFITCGLRVNEMANIRLEDIKYENGQYRLYVLGKGRNAKTDFVIVPNYVFGKIQAFVEKNNITDYLFVSTSNNNNGGQLHPASIRRIINGIFERMGIKSETIVVHSLRHSFATISIESGEDIREVSRAMRHKSVAVTERYLHDLDAKNNKCSNLVASKLFGDKEHRNNEQN